MIRTPALSPEMPQPIRMQRSGSASHPQMAAMQQQTRIAKTSVHLFLISPPMNCLEYSANLRSMGKEGAEPDLGKPVDLGCKTTSVCPSPSNTIAGRTCSANTEAQSNRREKPSPRSPPTTPLTSQGQGHHCQSHRRRRTGRSLISRPSIALAASASPGEGRRDPPGSWIFL